MIYSIGQITIDTDAYEVRKNGLPVSIEPQVFDLLVLLIENRDRIVTRDEIVERVWRGRIVSDAAISSRIKAARRAIGDDGKAQGLIRTVHRRGLRFVGEIADDSVLNVPPPSSQSTPGRALILSADQDVPGRTMLGPAHTIEDAHTEQADSAAGLDLRLPKRPSLVVLPFILLGGSEHGQIIADGLSLDIMTRLARTRWLFVISRGTAFTFRGPIQDVRRIALRLGVRYVIQGNVQFFGQRVRVTAALTDALAEHEVWAEQFDRSVDDFFAIQDEIANLIVGTVESEIEQSERQRALLVHPANIDAWSAYHRGAWLMYQFTPDGYEEAERLFKVSAKLDPNSARVYAGLSFVHWQRAFLEIGRDREGEISQALEYAQQALSVDPRDPQGHWALGRAFLLQKDFDLAIQEIDHSIELSPSFAIGHYSSSFARLLSGDHDGCELAVQQARRLSPYDLMSFAMLAAQAFNAALRGRVEDGANLADLAARQPNAHYHILAIAAFCNTRARRDAVARQYIKQLAAVRPGYRITDYFRAFPYRGDDLRKQIRDEFLKLGLQD